jgi:hypothetical protein
MRQGWMLRNATQVEVSGSALVSREQVIDAANIRFPQPLLGLQPSELSRNLSDSLPVELVRVSRLMMPPRLRIELKDRQVAFDSGRKVLADVAAANRKATADASLAATSKMNSSTSYSPYRSNSGGSGGSPPFANARVGSGMSIGIGPWGAYVGMSLGNF